MDGTPAYIINPAIQNGLAEIWGSPWWIKLLEIYKGEIVYSQRGLD
jgi:hypothetical protein